MEGTSLPGKRAKRLHRVNFTKNGNRTHNTLLLIDTDFILV